MFNGVDLSQWNTVDDYAALARAIQFAYVKCSDATHANGVWTPFEDKAYQHHTLSLRAQGTPTGSYAFGHPSQDPLACADFFVSHAWFDQLRPVIDMESLAEGNITPANAGPWCLAWLARVEANTGVRPLVYSGLYYGKDMLHQCPDLARYDFWDAAYTGTLVPPTVLPAGPWGRVVAFQWTGSGRVDGVRGDVDRDVCFDLGTLCV